MLRSKLCCLSVLVALSLVVCMFYSATNIVFAGSNTTSATGFDGCSSDAKGKKKKKRCKRCCKTTIYTAGGLQSGKAILNDQNVWTDFPDLSITFVLTDTATVNSSYSIAMANSNFPIGGAYLPETITNSHLVTRLLVDGVVVTRTISGDILFWGNSEDWSMELGAGSHTIKVQYRTPLGGTNYPTGPGSLIDWNNRVLQVMVHGTN